MLEQPEFEKPNILSRYSQGVTKRLGDIAGQNRRQGKAPVGGGDAYSVAESMVGKGEVPDRAILQEFLANGGENLDPATTAWCAAFVNAVLAKSGGQGTGKLNARSFMDWGQEVDQPQRGDVAVFSRGDADGWQGHVGFFDSYGDDGQIRVLGGNQGDSVNISGYDPSTLLGFRRANPMTQYAGF